MFPWDDNLLCCHIENEIYTNHFICCWRDVDFLMEPIPALVTRLVPLHDLLTARLCDDLKHSHVPPVHVQVKLQTLLS